MVLIGHRAKPVLTSIEKASRWQGAKTPPTNLRSYAVIDPAVRNAGHLCSKLHEFVGTQEYRRQGANFGGNYVEDIAATVEMELARSPWYNANCRYH